MAPYHYNSLTSSDKPTIRILTLSAGTGDDPLYGTLEETCLHNEVPPYDALSYCWGHPALDAVIDLDCSRGSLAITKTLDCALRVLRYQDKVRRLWIDQICINQQDQSERSHQVRLMWKIYSCAEHTVVWLGNDEQEQGPLVRDLFDAFQAMGIACHGPESCVTTRPAHMPLTELVDLLRLKDTFHTEDEQLTVNRETVWFPTNDILGRFGLPDRSSKHWPAFNALLDSPYFTRVWTLQEVLSSCEAVIVWGTTELPWPSLRGAYRWAVLNHCMTNDPRLNESSPRLSTIHFLHRELLWFRGFRYQTLAELVVNCCHGFEASDPRDQIYAFVSLTTDGQNFEIDYDKTEAEVFTDFAKYVLRSGDLTMLNQAGLRQNQNSLLPSWVPSWRSRLPSSYWSGNAQDRESSSSNNLNKPMVPLAGGAKGFLASGDSTGDLRESDKQDQFLVKGFRLDQAKLVCACQAYPEGDPDSPICVLVATQYHQLCTACAEPSLSLPEMLYCLTAANTREDSFKHDELLAQFISFVFINTMSDMDKLEPKDAEAFRMICLASNAMDGGAPMESDFSQFPANVQDLLTSRVRQFCHGQLRQEETEQVVEGISSYWSMENARQFYELHELIGKGRKLFVTTQGQVGLGPARMSTTDIIIIAFGGKTPYVLRPVPGTQEEYTLLGDCYIYGLMHGEAMHGMKQEDHPEAQWFCLGSEPDLSGNEPIIVLSDDPEEEITDAQDKPGD